MNNETSSGTGAVRKLVLVGLLVAVIGIFAFDRFVSKPGFTKIQEKVDKITTLKQDSDGKAVLKDGVTVKAGDMNEDGKITSEDVAKFIGKKPSKTDTFGKSAINDGEQTCETYTFGLPLPKLGSKLYVLYEGDVFSKTMNAKPEASDFRKPINVSNDNPRPVSSGGDEDAAKKAYDEKKQKEREAEAKDKEEESKDGASDDEEKKDD